MGDAIGRPQRGSKHEKVRMLLCQGDSEGNPLTCADIARIVGTDHKYVNTIARRYREQLAGNTVTQKIARLDQDLRDLRALVMYKLDAGRYGVKTERLKRSA